MEFIDDRHVALGARPLGRTIIAGEEGPELAKEAAIKPALEPSSKTEYYVSYAWGDSSSDEARQREQIVDKLCTEAEKKGITVIRNKTAMRYGDRISKFMSRLARGDRIFIVLSDKYLKSAYCMHELFDVWRNCREDDVEFIKRTRIFTLPCAKISKPLERAQYAIHWREKFGEIEAVVKAHGQLVLSDEDNAEYRLMTRFVNETANVLKLVQDILKPKSFDEFVTHGFDDPSPR